MKKANELATKVYEEAAKQSQATEDNSTDEKEDIKEKSDKDDVVDAEFVQK